MEIAYVCRVIGYAFALKWFAFITIPDLLCLQNIWKNLPPGLCTKVLLLGTRNCFLICSFNAVNNHERTVSFFILNIQFISLQLWWLLHWTCVQAQWRTACVQAQWRTACVQAQWRTACVQAQWSTACVQTQWHTACVEAQCRTTCVQAQ